MIHFRSVTSQNFLSIGDNPVTVKLDYGVPTLVTGKNGNGKSGSVIEPLVFGLFGKSFRGIVKAGLVNSVNKRKCLVKVRFDIGKTKYEVVRGIKPTIFDIYVDGEKENNDAAARDQQKYLESQILKTNYKSFSQVVILGSAAYVPFMQLKASERRDVIETLLDISVFSDMNKLLKEEVSVWKAGIQTKKLELSSTEHEIELLSGFIEKLAQSSTLKKDKSVAELDKIKRGLSVAISSLRDAKTDLINCDKQIALLDIDAVRKLEDDVKRDLYGHSTNIKRLKKELKYFTTTDTCTVCDQPITEEHRSSHITSIKEEIALTEQLVSEATEEVNKHTVIINKHRVLSDLRIEIEKKISFADARKNDLFSSGRKLKDSLLEENVTNNDSISEEKTKLKKMKDKKRSLEGALKELLAQGRVYSLSSNLLKDDGIKSAIIKQYLPVLNTKVNTYLQALNFNVKFELDETFKETIKSRYRDEFTYESFSMGERQRLDLALLFGWRDVARMKNSVNCNLIIMDEIFDSSLDQSGLEDLLSILNKQSSTLSTMVISHRNGIEDKFKEQIEFEKHNGFTRIATP